MHKRRGIITKELDSSNKLFLQCFIGVTLTQNKEFPSLIFFEVCVNENAKHIKRGLVKEKRKSRKNQEE